MYKNVDVESKQGSNAVDTCQQDQQRFWLQQVLAVACTLANGIIDKVCTVVFDDDDQQDFHYISCHIVFWKDGFDCHRSFPLDIVFKVSC